MPKAISLPVCVESCYHSRVDDDGGGDNVMSVARRKIPVEVPVRVEVVMTEHGSLVRASCRLISEAKCKK